MDDLATIRNEALSAVEQAPDLGALDAVRVAALGKKGSVTGLMKTLGTLAPEQRKEFGARVNQLKGEIAPEIYRLVEDGLIGEADFREFVFANPVCFYTSANPDFFRGTRCEEAAVRVVAGEA